MTSQRVLVLLVSLGIASRAQNPAKERAEQDLAERTVADSLSSVRPLVADLLRMIDRNDTPGAFEVFDKVEAAMRGLRSATANKDTLLISMEKALATSQIARERFIGLTAMAAESAGQDDKARRYASEALALSWRDSRFPAQNLYFGNHVLGLLALRNNDVAGARAYLLSSAATKGWPEFQRSGPNLTLARRLLQRGERDAVVDFLEICKRLWPDGRTRLEQWQAIIRAGSEPEWNDAQHGPLP